MDRILHIVTIMNAGGIESFIMNIYRNINKEKFQFDFLVHRSEKGLYDDEILQLGGRIFVMPAINPLKHGKYLNALNNFFEEYADIYPIVHSHINAFSSFALAASKRAGIKNRISHAHTDRIVFDFKFLFKLYAKSKINKYATYRMSCSSNAGKWLFSGKDFDILNNAIEVQKFKFNNLTRAKYRQELGLENKLVIGHVGSFTYPKNHVFLIDLINEIRNINSSAILVLIGDGAGRLEIEKKVKSLGLESFVMFLGVRKDIANILCAMDFFVFPSIYEGLPVTLIEAQASGLKIFSSDSVTNKVKFLMSLEFLSIKMGPQFWAKRILSKNFNLEDREIGAFEAEMAGYDIKSEVLKIENIYSQLILKDIVL